MHRASAIIAVSSLAVSLCLSVAIGTGLAAPSSRVVPSPARTYVTVPAGELTSDTTWSRADSPFLVTGQLFIRPQATLTIEPGVEVRFNEHGELLIEGSLVASGTRDQPIKLLGSDERAGSWRGVSLLGRSDGVASARFAHATIAHGGTGTDYRGMIYVYRGVLELSDSEVRDAGADAIFVDSGAIRLARTRITGNAGTAIRLRSLSETADPVLTDVTIAGNSLDAIVMDGGNVARDALWEDVGVPYRVDGQIFIRVGATLTVEPGVDIRFTANGGLYVQGSLSALGTTDLPITLVGDEARPGAWRGINVQGPSGSPGRVSFQHVTLANAGNVDLPAIDVYNGRVSFIDGLISNNAGVAFRFSGADAYGHVEGTQIVDSGASAIANETDHTLLAPNNWWGSPSGPATDDACAGGTGARIEGPVRFAPWLRSADERPDPLAPADIPVITLAPQRWYAPADGQTRVWIDATLRDPQGRPVSGARVNVLSTFGQVTSGGITDATGHTLAYLTSTQPGDTELSAALSTTDRCDQADTTTATVTFTDEADGLIAGMQAPYLYDGIEIEPEPVTRGVPTTIRARVTNPNDAPVRVEASFEFAQSGIGLAFGPVGAPQTKDIPAGGEAVFEVIWTPVVSGRYCVQVLYHVVAGVGDATGAGAIAAAGAIGPPAGIPSQGAAGGRGQRNLNVYGGGLGGGGGGGDGGPPGGKPPLEKARKMTNMMGNIGSIGTGETFIPGFAAGELTNWQYRKAAQISKALGGDPPRQDYKVVAEPQRVTLPAMERPAGASDQRFNAYVALRDALAEFIAVGDAAAISFDRYGGAATAGDLEWASVQASSLLHYRKLTGDAAVTIADRLAALRTIIEAEGGTASELTVQQVVDGQARLRTAGFAREEIAAAHAVGLDDATIEQIRQELVSLDPQELAGPFVDRLRDTEAALRGMGQYLVEPVNFPDEPGRETAGSPLLGGAGTGQAASNLARIYAHTSTIQIGNPLDHEATIDLRARRISMPSEWAVELSSASVTLAPGEEATITVHISATTPSPQGSMPEVAVEGYADGQLLGGVVVALLVPKSVPFGVVPGAGPPILLIAGLLIAVLVLVAAAVIVLLLRRRRRRALGRVRPDATT